jgi:putative Holliday junction resolvase
MALTPKSILALDVGDRRVGVAVTSLIARLPRPLITLERGDNFIEKLRVIINDESIDRLIVGLPRGLNGQTTAQTEAVETFVNDLKQQFDLPIYFQDEAVTSKKAEAELEARRKPYVPGDIDALAATYILEDYLADNQGKEGL